MIHATDLIGMLAYNGDAFASPFTVTAANITEFASCDPPDDGWVVLWHDPAPPGSGALAIIHASATGAITREAPE